MTEIFKDIAGYEGLYQVSNMGNIKSLNYGCTGKEKILQPGLNKNGYLMVQLYKDRKRKPYFIHRLVAKSFIPNPNGYPCLNHKNEVKTDNRVENLEWCTYLYNNTYNDKHLKFAKPIYCVELDKIFSSSLEAECQTGIYHGNINKCLKGKRKTAGGYHWTYVKK